MYLNHSWEDKEPAPGSLIKITRRPNIDGYISFFIGESRNFYETKSGVIVTYLYSKKQYKSSSGFVKATHYYFFVDNLIIRSLDPGRHAHDKLFRWELIHTE